MPKIELEGLKSFHRGGNRPSKEMEGERGERGGRGGKWGRGRGGEKRRIIIITIYYFYYSYGIKYVNNNRSKEISHRFGCYS